MVSMKSSARHMLPHAAQPWGVRSEKALGQQSIPSLLGEWEVKPPMGTWGRSSCWLCSPNHHLPRGGNKLVMDQKSGLQTSQNIPWYQGRETQVSSPASKPMSVPHLVAGDAASQIAPAAYTIPENCLQTRCNKLGGEQKSSSVQMLPLHH